MNKDTLHHEDANLIDVRNSSNTGYDYVEFAKLNGLNPYPAIPLKEQIK